MQPAIEQLTKWEAVNIDLASLLIDPEKSSTGVPRMQMIELYNIATGYKITRDDYVGMGFQPLDVLVKILQHVPHEVLKLHTHGCVPPGAGTIKDERAVDAAIG